MRDPSGHSYGHPPRHPEPIDPEHWDRSRDHLLACDLFNHGYYWEAHEAWESLWHAAGRHGRVANFLKGLIKLAAAYVKAREGNPRGVERHALRSVELLKSCRNKTDEDAKPFCGAELASLIDLGDQLATSAESFAAPQPELLLSAVMELNA